MKKRFYFFLVLLILIPLISAQSYQFDKAVDIVSRILDSAIGLMTPFLEKVIGDYSSSEFFFGKVLLLILLIIICAKILEKTPLGGSNTKVSWIISIIISILAVRFINDNNFFEAIFVQYGTLGIAITTILPMAIFFYFVNNLEMGTFGRKMFWFIYGAILTGIWISKQSEIDEIANYIYIASVLACAIFIFLDKSIHSYFGLSHIKAFMKKENREGIYRAKEIIKKARERLDTNIINRWEYNQIEREEIAKIKEFSKDA